METDTFCSKCNSYIANPGLGVKASILDRLLAEIITSMFAFSFLESLIFFEKSPIIKGLIVFVFYSILYLFFRQGLNPGKYILHLRVMDTTTGKQASIIPMLIREFPGKFASGMLTLGFGYVLALFNPNYQTLHDKLARTVVIKETNYIKNIEKAYSS
ncbi:MAG: hypothetical protein A2Y40_05085 [Candidatus Margulisbacteria bacterium GWF2_35_9]|nr:MAG: hypothetical protein A2Y40_05085 [Candidatus Margulisbacteria bacterium GWF2_35_9]